MIRFFAMLVLLLSFQGKGDVPEVRPAADPVVLLQPADTSVYVSARPVLLWTSGPGAVRYVVQIAGDSGFTRPAFVDSTVVDTTLRIPRPLENDSTYFWRVGTVDSASALVFSGSWSFRTGTLPAFSADSLAFPATRIGDSTAAFVILKNRMPVPLLVDSVVSPSGSYHFLDGASFLLPPSDSLVCSVLFRPVRFRRVAEDLILHTEQGTLRLPVTGDSPPPVLALSRQKMEFGTVAVSDTVVRTVVLRNRGTVNRLTYTLRNRRFSPYRLLRHSHGSIAPGESLAVAVRFHVQSYLAAGFGFHTDTLQVETDGGRAFVPLIGDSPPPRPRCAPQGLTYPEVAISDTVANTVRIWNSSVNLLRVDSIRTRSGRFSCTLNRTVIRRADTADATVRFFPDRSGTFVDTILVFNNSWVSPFRVPVEGFAPPPLLEADAEDHDFGQVVVGSRMSVYITFVNRSVSPLRIDAPYVRTRGFTLSGWRGPARLRYGDTVGVTVWFSPDSLRQYQDTLFLPNNSPRTPARIPLAGSGTRSLNPATRVEPVFELYQNFPNPFSNETTFRYVLPNDCTVELEVFTTLGEHIETIFSGVQGEGFHNVTWAPRLATGVYYYRLRATPEGRPDKAVSATRKMVITR